MLDDNKTKPTTLHDQLLLLSKQAGAAHEALKDRKVKAPKETQDDLENLETVLGELSKSNSKGEGHRPALIGVLG